jgi:protein involved in polysaccharide export with SLBB domain
MAAMVVVPGRVSSQAAPTDAGRLQSSRAELEALLQDLQATSQSRSQSEESKRQARSLAELVRKRLGEGDFHVGDQVEITVEGEPAMQAVNVEPGRILRIPNMGELSLQGVLRSELNERVRSHVARYIQNPIVRTRSLIRIAITGQIAKPGFLVLAAETPLPDVIMTAGGPTPGAKLDKMEISRGDDRIWSGGSLRQAVAEGRTLDQLGLQSGDKIMVPGKGESSTGRILQLVGLISGLVVGIVSLTKL